MHDDTNCNDSIMDELIGMISDVLLASTNGIDTKLNAISLLVCIVLKYPAAFKRNESVFHKIAEKKERILEIENSCVFCNINKKVSLTIALALLNTSMGEDGDFDYLECVSYIQSDKATILAVLKMLVEYLEVDNDVRLSKTIVSVVIQNVLQWLRLDNLEIRQCATRLLLMLCREPEHEKLVNQRIINLIDSENYFIKNIILRHLYETIGIYESTRELIIDKCQNDPCFVVRMLCEDVKKSLHLDE